MKLTFPERLNNGTRKHRRYWDTYYRYTLNLFLEAGCQVRYVPEPPVGSGRYLVHLNDAPVMIDYWDLLDLDAGFEDYPVYFKFHYSKAHHDQFANVFPFPPISFYDWKNYRDLAQSANYSSQNNNILSRQHPHGNAQESRRKVQRELGNYFGNRVKTNRIDQNAFWKEVSHGLVSVCVPGYRNDMLDRGQWQYMALGGCTLAPPLLNVLPPFQPLVAGEHYVSCAPDYHDLIDRIHWCETNRSKCEAIGRNAKNLFESAGKPETVFAYIQSTMASIGVAQ